MPPRPLPPLGFHHYTRTTLTSKGAVNRDCARINYREYENRVTLYTTLPMLIARDKHLIIFRPMSNVKKVQRTKLRLVQHQQRRVRIVNCEN